MKNNTNPVPQVRVHTNLIAGESIAACQQNLDYWTNQLQKKCSGRSNIKAPGYKPWKETEMQWWQAGDV
jgi:hypothetical protein